MATTILRKNKVRKRETPKEKHSVDKVLLVFSIAMSIFGAIMIFDASVYVANAEFGDPTHFLKFQIIWLFFGALLAIILYFWDYRKYTKLTPLFFLGTIGLLALVLVLGTEINNAKTTFY